MAGVTPFTVYMAVQRDGAVWRASVPALPGVTAASGVSEDHVRRMAMVATLERLAHGVAAGEMDPVTWDDGWVTVDARRVAVAG